MIQILPMSLDHLVFDCCEDWQLGIDEMNRYIMTEQARNPQNTYEGKPFEYCPWCGANKERAA